MRNWEGCGRKQSWPNLRYYPRPCLETEKNHEESISKADVTIEVGNRLLSRRCRSSQPTLSFRCGILPHYVFRLNVRVIHQRINSFHAEMVSHRVVEESSTVHGQIIFSTALSSFTAHCYV